MLLNFVSCAMVKRNAIWACRHQLLLVNDVRLTLSWHVNVLVFCKRLCFCTTSFLHIFKPWLFRCWSFIPLLILSLFAWPNVVWGHMCVLYAGRAGGNGLNEIFRSGCVLDPHPYCQPSASGLTRPTRHRVGGERFLKKLDRDQRSGST